MAKAFAIGLLLAASILLVSANGHGDKSINIDTTAASASVQESMTSLHSSLQDAIKIHHGDLSGCECKKDCEDVEQEVCKVTTKEEEVCEEVEKTKDYIECATKCYKADKVVEINVPTVDLSHLSHGKRRLLESTPVQKADGTVSITHPLAAVHSAIAGGADKTGDKTEGPKEICREVCKPSTRTVKKEECEMVPKKDYDCKKEVVDTKCVTNCKCGDKITVQLKEVPDYAAALAKSGHPKAAVAGAVLQALP